MDGSLGYRGISLQVHYHHVIYPDKRQTIVSEIYKIKPSVANMLPMTFFFVYSNAGFDSIGSDSADISKSSPAISAFSNRRVSESFRRMPRNQYYRTKRHFHQ